MNSSLCRITSKVALLSRRFIVRVPTMSASSKDVASMRVDYDSGEFLLEDGLAAKEPMGQFEIWFKEAVGCKEIQEANAMVLSTCSKYVK